ncbi:hypothetical protein [Streptosporangium saharense]|uniref:hypothetical protein n=1 Tax=Streptosporangium saharense TaxID=1706840 RepID=UPI00331FAF65
MLRNLSFGIVGIVQVAFIAWAIEYPTTVPNPLFGLSPLAMTPTVTTPLPCPCDRISFKDLTPRSFQIGTGNWTSARLPAIGDFDFTPRTGGDMTGRFSCAVLDYGSTLTRPG